MAPDLQNIARRNFLALIAILLGATSALALEPAWRAWLLSAAPRAALSMDFRREVDPRLTMVRASNATDYSGVLGTFATVASNVASAPTFSRTGNLAQGLGVFTTRTNLYQNSSGAQTRTIANASAYGIWCESSDSAGTITLTVGLVGVVTCNGPAGFTIITSTSTSATLTPSGTVTFGQLTVSAGFWTPPILTTNAAVTRAADVPSIALSSFGFNATQGTLAVDFVPYGTGQTGSIVNIDDGSNNNRVRLFKLNTDVVKIEISVGGVVVGFAVTTGTVNFQVPNRIAASWTTGRVAVSLNGSIPVVATLSNFPTGLTTMRPGADAAGATQLAGGMQRLRYYPTYIAALEVLQ